ncbi:choline/carnitine/betaine transport [Kineococcus rhizosphaerae]|uniref:Choline/carnitine/betaine transport n=1 Tax=Kineococcus rhizosphaerae TaxID=559628 RepID=A0A2T0R480_9ACTN|nr:choline/carnitine/betaine transport [Kineococcus rhizosphaerae]
MVILFLLVGAVWPTQLKAGADAVLEVVVQDFGWAFVLGATGFVVLALVLAFSRYGRIRLGRDEDRPEHSRASWVAMMFSAGMGIGLMFYGVTEPVTHLMTVPQGDAEPGSQAAAREAMDYSLFHWGLHPWAIYAVVGLALAYSSYRKERAGGFSAAFAPLLRGRRGRGAARVIDVFAIFATLFGSAVSLGLGAAQMNGGLTEVFGVPNSTTVKVAIIAVLTVCFVVSAISGIERGIKWLSNTNMVLALALLFFLFVVGPTVFVLDLVPASLGNYLTALPHMATRTGAFGGTDWLSAWTLFYWAWWVSWTPFVGAFLAKISKGRTIREFVIGVMLVPTAVSLVWFSVLGGAAIDLQRRFVEGTGGADIAGIADQESQMFTFLDQFPWAGFTSVLVVVLVAIFFVSGADASSIVMGSLSSYGVDEPQKWLTAVWGALMGLVAIVLFFAGGLEALQDITIIAAAPFLVLMVVMAVALVKDLVRDPAVTTQKRRSGDRRDPRVTAIDHDWASPVRSED